MQEDTKKCPECKGSGKLLKLWPLTAIAMPHELGWQRFTCWRCKGTGTLSDDDPYVRHPPRVAKTWPPHSVAVWFWLFAAANLFVITILLWP